MPPGHSPGMLSLIELKKKLGEVRPCLPSPHLCLASVSVFLTLSTLLPLSLPAGLGAAELSFPSSANVLPAAGRDHNSGR